MYIDTHVNAFKMSATKFVIVLSMATVDGFHYISKPKSALQILVETIASAGSHKLKKAYSMLFFFQSVGQENWASRVKRMLYTNGFGYVWENQHVENENEFPTSFTRRLKDKFLQNWSENIENSSKLVVYKQFKLSFGYEYYIDIVNIRKFNKCFGNF